MEERLLLDAAVGDEIVCWNEVFRDAKGRKRCERHDEYSQEMMNGAIDV